MMGLRLLVVTCLGCDDARDSADFDPADLDGDGYNPAEGDCNEEDASINPGAEEIPGDRIDENCDYTYFPATPITEAGHRIPGVDPGSYFGSQLDISAANEQREGLLVVLAAAGNRYRPELHLFSGAEAFAEGPVARAIFYDEQSEAQTGEYARVIDLDDGQRAVVAGVENLEFPRGYCAWGADTVGRVEVADAVCAPSFIDTSASVDGGFGARSDIDGDGEFDLVMAGTDRGGEYGLWLLAGPLSLERFAGDPEWFPFEVGTAGRVWTPGDLDGDGYGDTAVLSYLDTTASLTIVPGGGGFAGAASIHGEDPELGQVFAFGDVDGDGQLDLCGNVSHHAGPEGHVGTVVCFIGPFRESRSLRDATWTASGETDRGTFGSELAALDWDGDGDAELAVGASRTRSTNHGLAYVLDPGSADATPLAVFTDPDASQLGSALAAGDLDNDGLDELVVGAPASESTGAGSAWLLAGSQH